MLKFIWAVQNNNTERVRMSSQQIGIRENDAVRVVKLRHIDSHSAHLIDKVKLQEKIEIREVGVTGIVRGYIPGTGGDFLFVKHYGCSKVGLYQPDELQVIQPEELEVL